jgi:hypothetical protein
VTDLAAHKLEMPKAVAKLPAAIRRHIATQCQGDWRRVTIDPDGSVTVHNKPQFTRVELPAQKAPVKRAVKREPKPKPPLAPRGRLETTEVVSAGPAAPPPSPTLPRPAPPAIAFRPPALRIPPPPQREVISRPASLPKPLPPVRRSYGEDVDLSPVAAFAADLARQMSAGIPLDVEYKIHPNVLEMYGIDFEILDCALRSPTSVEIASETYEKGYTILRFHRADVMIAVGYRDPNEPMVLAHYAAGSLTGSRDMTTNLYRPARRGLPRSPAQMLAKFVAMGARCERNPSGNTASVYMGDQNLGSVTIDRMAAAQNVSADFIRIIRKIKAIQHAAEAAG